MKNEYTRRLHPWVRAGEAESHHHRRRIPSGSRSGCACVWPPSPCNGPKVISASRRTREEVENGPKEGGWLDNRERLTPGETARQEHPPEPGRVRRPTGRPLPLAGPGPAVSGGRDSRRPGVFATGQSTGRTAGARSRPRPGVGTHEAPARVVACTPVPPLQVGIVISCGFKRGESTSLEGFADGLFADHRGLVVARCREGRARIPGRLGPDAQPLILAGSLQVR